VSRESSLRLRLIFAGLALLLANGLAAQPLDVVRKCADSASLSVNGVAALEAVCPGLRDALAGAGLDAILPEGWQQKINAHGLADLSALAQQYSHSQRHAPDTASLAAVLETLQREQTPEISSWWQSFKTWLKNWLAQSDSALASWLNRLLDRWSASSDVSVTFLKVVTYCLTALVVIAAALIVVREVKAAGVGRRARRRAQANLSNPGSAPSDFESGLVAGSSADALAVLLHALVKRLLQLGRLRAERSLTHRELVVRSEFDSNEQRAAFAAVAYGAEANFYGPRDFAPVASDEVKRRGEALLAQLAELKSKS
jgi:hypothetical protein